MKSATRVQPGAGSPRRLEPANRSVNRPSQAPQRPDPSTLRNQKDSDRPIQSPGSAPLTNNPEDRRSSRPPTGGPRRPVGEMGYKGGPAGRQSENRGKREKGRHMAAERSREALRTRTTLRWTRWMRASVFGWPRATLLLALTRSASCPAHRYPPPASSRRAFVPQSCCVIGIVGRCRPASSPSSRTRHSRHQAAGAGAGRGGAGGERSDTGSDRRPTLTTLHADGFDGCGPGRRRSPAGPAALPWSTPDASVPPRHAANWDAVEGVYFRSTTGFGVGGMMTIDFEPLIFLRDGTSYEIGETALVHVDLAAERTAKPRSFGRWKRVRGSFVLTDSRGASNDDKLGDGSFFRAISGRRGRERGTLLPAPVGGRHECPRWRRHDRGPEPIRLQSGRTLRAQRLGRRGQFRGEHRRRHGDRPATRARGRPVPPRPPHPHPDRCGRTQPAPVLRLQLPERAAPRSIAI
jgi:hypothetical protein